jgi:transcription initiation factor TFIIIB Brf1 subunit/transcription initiation factor TFIIB
MDFEKHFDFIDTLSKDQETGKEACCQQRENIQIERGMTKCKVCSNIISNIVDNPEWRYYGSGDSKTSDPTRCGMPVNSLLPESSVGSSIGYNSNTKTMNQIRKYQQWNGMPYKERSLYKVFLEIQEVCKKHNLPNIIINEAKSLYSIISKTKISRGANRKGIIAACVYFSCKECNVPRSSNEIAEMFNIESTIMTKGVKKCQEIISMNKKNKKRLTTSPSIHAHDFIERFCNRLGIDEESTQKITTICRKCMDENLISENTPPSIAAGCIYYYIKQNEIENTTKKDISTICKISEVTINKCTKKIESNKELFE